MQFDDIVVFQFMQNGNLAISSLGIDVIMEGIKDLLQGSFHTCLLICDFPDVPIGSTAEKLLNLECLKQLWVDFFTHVPQIEIYIVLNTIQSNPTTTLSIN